MIRELRIMSEHIPENMLEQVSLDEIERYVRHGLLRFDLSEGVMNPGEGYVALGELSDRIVNVASTLKPEKQKRDLPEYVWVRKGRLFLAHQHHFGRNASGDSGITQPRILLGLRSCTWCKTTYRKLRVKESML